MDQYITRHISLTDILNDLNYRNIPQNSHSSEEWSEIWGFGTKKTLKTLKNNLISGKMESMWISKPDITGRMNNSYIYWYKNGN